MPCRLPAEWWRTSSAHSFSGPVRVRADHAGDQRANSFSFGTLAGRSVGLAADAVVVPVKAVGVVGADPDGAWQVRAVHIGDTSGRSVRGIWACRGVRSKRVR